MGYSSLRSNAAYGRLITVVSPPSALLPSLNETTGFRFRSLSRIVELTR